MLSKLCYHILAGWPEFKIRKMLSCRLLITVCLLLLPSLCSSARSVEYVLEGQDVTLKCRIPRPVTRGARLYWMGPVNGTMDNYAIDNGTFNRDYSVALSRPDGRYDLTIKRVTYERNNGQFVCRAQDLASGIDHSEPTLLTVLIKPGSPRITPLNPTFTQGDRFELTCSSQGGSPDPDIVWYRRGDPRPLESVLKPGGGRDIPTTSVLSRAAEREDDRAEFLCEVRNRALSSHEKMAAAVTLDVNYYPVVAIRPSNPVRALAGSAVTLTCDVDAKPPVKNVRWLRGGTFIQTRHSMTLPSVTQDDAGRYICQANNNLGRSSSAEVTLQVLMPPVVRVLNHRGVDEGADVTVSCNATGNPPPAHVFWTKEGDLSFRRNNPTLRLNGVAAVQHGKYICHAVSVMSPSSGPEVRLEGNASMWLRIRHAPGRATIYPIRPVAVEGETTVLSCIADPPGFPTPKVHWWRDDGPLMIGSRVVLNMSTNYTISSALADHAGSYSCQPYNRYGNGTVATAHLRVFRAPRLTTGLTPTAVYRRERTDLRLSCSARGEPRPSVKWFKDGKELGEDGEFYAVRWNATEINNGGEKEFSVRSMLLFRGSGRVGLTALRPEDRGLYECRFENDAASVNSTQLLRIQHPPSAAHRISRVAADEGADASLICVMRSFPAPSFSWQREGRNLASDNSGTISAGNSRYTLNTSETGGDVYSSVLTIGNIVSSDYGEYTCRAANDQGPSKAVLRLQKRSAPAAPFDGMVTNATPYSVSVSFEPGFDGGFPHDTNYSAVLRSPSTRDERVISCGLTPVCEIDSLPPNTAISVSVFAVNPIGKGDMSKSITASTTLDPAAIPAPKDVMVEAPAGIVAFGLPSDNSLRGRLQVRYQDHGDWTTLPARVQASGNQAVFEMGRIEPGTDVRVKICAVDNDLICGPFQMAKKVSQLPAHIIKASTEDKMTIVVAVIAASLIAAAILAVVLCCCCRRQRHSKLKKKKAEMEVSHRGVATQQAPPPPYYTVGLENKAMDGSIDRLNDHSKSVIYGLQSQPQPQPQQQPQQQPYHNYSQNMQNPNPNGLGVGYMDNSYSNSNNGGSVNSQDSLWQVKGQHQQQTQQSQTPQMGASPMEISSSVDQRNGYQYNPLVHGGYGMTGYDDYAHYPPRNEQDYAPNNYNNLNSDPYGVHKSLDTVDDPGYDVTGLGPSPYLDQNHGPPPPHPMTPPHDTKPHMSFDESLESGLSTPNSRNRRVIREIIV